jgi:hypothetical protein
LKQILAIIFYIIDIIKTCIELQRFSRIVNIETQTHSQREQADSSQLIIKKKKKKTHTHTIQLSGMATALHRDPAFSTKGKY